MFRLLHPLSLLAIFLAVTALLLSVPGGVCACAKAPSDACPCDRADGDPCGEREADGGCDHGCALVCCSHPPMLGAIATAYIAPQTPSDWLTQPPAAALETSSCPPPLPPPRA